MAGKTKESQDKQIEKVIKAAQEVAQAPKSKKARAQFWLSLQSMRKHPTTRKTQLLSNEDLMTLAMIKKAKAGNVLAYTALMDRAYGKPKQEIETNNNHRHTIAAFKWGELPSGAEPIPLETEDAEVEEIDEEE